ncbi:MAG: restriction endonuclease subunit S [Proteobacteria bacterium]|nr:restriction endonuclease subunit S [Pseudomonadota bacterium]
MIAEIKPYPRMINSGVEWLGDVPAHWELPRIKTILCERSEKGFPDKPLLAATQTKGVVRKDQYENRTVLALKDLHLLKLVEVGDFVISLRSFQGGIEFARVQGIISPAYTVLFSSNQRNHGFLAQLFKSKPYIENLGFYVTGIREGQNVDYEKLRRSRLPLPPLPEQTAIVKYLDYVDKRVQRLVQIKRKLIALLTEQKKAIIHHAVTRGLDPDVPLKDSGVEWLGEVPAHWEVRRIRTIAEMRVSNVDKHTKEGEQPVRLCNYVDVYKNDYINKRMKFMHATATYNEIERFMLEIDDVLITKDSEAWDDIGVPALVTEVAEDLISGYHLAILKPFQDKLKGGYLLRALQSKGLAYQFHVEAKGVTRYGLSHSGIKSAWMPLPPLPEQTAIVEYLEKTTANIDSTISRANHEIKLLNEYQTRLIADVVTGKLDVRDAAASLPEVDSLVNGSMEQTI